jgi:hypothetical protein
MAEIARLAQTHDLPLVAIGDVLYHAPERRPLQDVLTCIRERETLATIGTRLKPNAERHLRSHAEMLHLFKGYEQAVSASGRGCSPASGSRLMSCATNIPTRRYSGHARIPSRCRRRRRSRNSLPSG